MTGLWTLNRTLIEVWRIGAVSWFVDFWGSRLPQEHILLLASTFSSFWSPIRNIYSHTNSLSAVSSSATFSRWIHNKSAFQHSPHHICLLEGSSWKKKKKKIIFCWYLHPPLTLLPCLSRACFLKEKRTYQPKDSIATFSSLSPMGRKLKLN